MLKIPGPGDASPPLMAPLRRATPEEGAPEGMVKKRRRGKKHGAKEDQSWESQPKLHRSSRREKRQMNLFLIGGALLLVLVLGGVGIALKVRRDNSRPAKEDVAVLPVAPIAKPERKDIEILTDAEPQVRKFLEATTVSQLEPLVRNPAITKARIEKFYPGGKIEAPGLGKFNSNESPSRVGNLMSVTVLTKDFTTRELAFFDTPEGIKIDWESWVGWSEMKWSEFRETKPETPQLFRVILSPVAYYNFGFTDDSKWQSYRLIAPDGDESIYGYVEKGSEIIEKLLPDPDVKKSPLTLLLRFPAKATTDNQVEIVGFVADGWVEGVEAK